MRRAAPNPDVVVLPGDFYMHRFAGAAKGPADEAGVRTLSRIVNDFSRAFPRAQFVVALGNNDAPCGDYRSELGTPFARAIAHLWAPLVDRRGAAPDFENAFARNGYYVANVPALHLRIVAIDTVLWSQIYGGNCEARSSGAPARQLAWLDATLRATRPDTHNVVLMHVPPGYDAFATQLAHGLVAWPYLLGADNSALVRALASPQNRVAFAIAGHAHRFNVRVAGDTRVVDIGSISPIYGTDPVFYTMRVDDAGGIGAFTAWSYDDSRWLPRAFEAGWETPQLDARGRIAYCAQTELGDGFVRCANLQRRVAIVPVVLVAIGLAIALLAFAMIRRRRAAT